MSKNKYFFSVKLLTGMISIAILALVYIAVIYTVKNLNHTNDMKSYEFSYDVDFLDPNALTKFQLEKSDPILKGNKSLIEKEIQFLFSVIKADREKLLRDPSYCINILFNGNQQEFIKKESFDYEYMHNALDSILSKIEKTHGDYFKLDFYFVGVIFRKYALVSSMSETWYLSKRINFTNEFLAYIAPNFANLLLVEDYMSTDIPFKNGNIINKENMASNIEEIMSNDEFHHDFYFGNRQTAEDILIEIQENINKKENLQYKKEAINIDALLREASQGINVLCIYNK